MPKGLLNNFITTPRYIVSDFKSGKITRNEWILYSWLRGNLNPYGVVSVALSGLKGDIFPNVEQNYINKLLLSLRSKKYIYYQDRQGRRGSFEVHMGELVLPNKHIKTLDKFFNPNAVRSESGSLAVGLAEASQELEGAGQKFKAVKSQFAKGFSTDIFAPPVRSPYNDNDIENDNNNLSFEKKSFKGTPVNTYKPTSSEYLRCQEIASQLGEKNMDYILSVLKKHGLGLIERAWGSYREQAETTNIESPPAYFNGIVKQLEKEQQSADDEYEDIPF